MRTLAIALAALALCVGCVAQPKPIAPANLGTSTAAGLGGASADVTALDGMLIDLSRQLTPAFAPYATIATRLIADLKQKLDDAARASDRQTANAASLYHDVIVSREETKQAKAAGDAALKSEQGHFWSYQQRRWGALIAVISVLGFVAYEWFAGGWLRTFVMKVV